MVKKIDRDKFILLVQTGALTCDLLDFEYGMFDMFGEKYPDWIKKYFKWKQSGR